MRFSPRVWHGWLPEAAQAGRNRKNRREEGGSTFAIVCNCRSGPGASKARKPAQEAVSRRATP